MKWIVLSNLNHRYNEIKLYEHKISISSTINICKQPKRKYVLCSFVWVFHFLFSFLSIFDTYLKLTLVGLSCNKESCINLIDEVRLLKKHTCHNHILIQTFLVDVNLRYKTLPELISFMIFWKQFLYKLEIEWVYRKL